MNPERILLIDDEEGLLTLLKITLNKERYDNIAFAMTGQEAISYLKENDVDLILLDVMLPDCSGFDLCPLIRQITTAPIIFLTACSSDYDKLSGLTIGGDDYVSKPFNTMELVARIKAIFRRQRIERQAAASMSEAVEPMYDFGSFRLYPAKAQLVVNGEVVEATAKELELLQYLCANPGRVFTAEQLYERIWNLPGIGGEKTVSIHISKLRKKLGDEQPHRMIMNLRGIGYKFVPPEGGEN